MPTTLQEFKDDLDPTDWGSILGAVNMRRHFIIRERIPKLKEKLAKVFKQTLL